MRLGPKNLFQTELNRNPSAEEAILEATQSTLLTSITIGNTKLISKQTTKKGKCVLEGNNLIITEDKEEEGEKELLTISLYELLRTLELKNQLFGSLILTPHIRVNKGIFGSLKIVSYFNDKYVIVISLNRKDSKYFMDLLKNHKEFEEITNR